MLILFEMTYLGQENYFQIRWKHVSALLRLILDQELVRSTDINIDFIFYHLIPFRLVIKWLLKPYTEQKGCCLLYIPLMVLQHQPKKSFKAAKWFKRNSAFFNQTNSLFEIFFVLNARTQVFQDKWFGQNDSQELKDYFFPIC